MSYMQPCMAKHTCKECGYIRRPLDVFHPLNIILQSIETTHVIDLFMDLLPSEMKNEHFS